MDFVDQLNQFIRNAEKIKDKLKTEEATKTSLILPFFSLLGYNVFNPDEFIPEFTADVGVKRNEKVDYAIVLDNVPTILIEAKACNEPLDKYASQLYRYFSVTKSKFAILTNGIVYEFFTDLDEPNKLDTKPFLTINLLKIKDTHINALKLFTKSNFCSDLLLDTAFEFKYLNEFKLIFSKQLKNPSDDFVRFFLNIAYTGIKTKKAAETFKPILKKAMNDFINESITEKLQTVLNEEENKNNVESENEKEKFNEQETKIITTPEELEGYFVIKNMLKDLVPMESISYKDTSSYINILYQNNIRKWICRLKITNTKKTLIIPDSNKNHIIHNLESVYDIQKYKNELSSALKSYISSDNGNNNVE